MDWPGTTPAPPTRLKRFAHRLRRALPSGQVVDDVPVEVGHDHDVELLRFADQLHAGVVDDH